MTGGGADKKLLLLLLVIRSCRDSMVVVSSSSCRRRRRGVEHRRALVHVVVVRRRECHRGPALGLVGHPSPVEGTPVVEGREGVGVLLVAAVVLVKRPVPGVSPPRPPWWGSCWCWRLLRQPCRAAAAVVAGVGAAVGSLHAPLAAGACPSPCSASMVEGTGRGSCHGCRLLH